MKKLLALFAIFILSFNLCYTQPVKADTFSIPFSAIPDLLNAFYTVASGGKIEFSALIGDMTSIDDFWQNLHDYYDTHYTQPLLQSTQNIIDIGLSGLALNGVDNIDISNNISIPINPQDLANFMGYDVNWTNRYDISDSITVNPDPNFSTYLDIINGSGYNPYISLGNGVSGVSQDWNKYGLDWSYVSIFGADYNGLSTSGINDGIYAAPITTLYINSSGNLYSCLVSFAQADMFLGTSANRGYFNKAGSYNSRWSQYFSQEVASNVATWSHSFQGTLIDVFEGLIRCCRNVNIYVDGELWAYTGDIPTPGITLDNSTPVGNTDNITYSVYPLTSTGDIGLDLAKWGEYIYNQCVSGSATLSMDTVIDDGWDLVDTEDGERAITTDDEEDVAKVIHGFVGTTATTPTPTPDIGDPPVLKIIPPILELPDEIWPDGGRDTTVLAQIIHATDVAIPNDIMTIFWSIIGILVIGGLISILHK